MAPLTNSVHFIWRLKAGNRENPNEKIKKYIKREMVECAKKGIGNQRDADKCLSICKATSNISTSTTITAAAAEAVASVTAQRIVLHDFSFTVI